jgi:small subunit ribosomal protein S20
VANTAQSKKRARQAETRREANMAQRSNLRTYVKKIIKAIEAKDKNLAQDAFKTAQPIIDRMANKRIIHRNKAARIKSRLNAHIKAL